MNKVQNSIFSIIKHKTDSHKKIWKKINRLMLQAYKQAGLNFIVRHLYWWYIKYILITGVKTGLSLSKIEYKIKRPFLKFKFLKNKKNHTAINNAKKRAFNTFSTIKNYLIGTKILDLGAGNGLIGQTIKNQTNKDVLLIDLVNHSCCELPLILYQENKSLPVKDKVVDTTLLNLVLHHANDPLQLLEEAMRVTKQRIIIIEGNISNPHMKLIYCFFDWYLNRIGTPQEINVPCNLLTNNQWEQTFKKFKLTIAKKELLNITEPVIPEYHVMYVLDKNNPG